MNKTEQLDELARKKTKEEMNEETGVDQDTFMSEKKFNEDSPLQYTNAVVIEEIKKDVEEESKGKSNFDSRAFVGQAVRLFQTDYPKYREYMERAGWVYDNSTK